MIVSDVVDPDDWSINDMKKWMTQVWLVQQANANQQRDIHFEKAELRDALVQRVQDAMKADERREQADAEIYKHDAVEQIEMDDLGKRKTSN